MTASDAYIYLDSNATTRPLPEVLEAMSRIMTGVWANPSSIHRAGQLARREVDAARMAVCELIGASPSEIIFTSGGTESVNTCLRSLARSRPQPLMITSAVEHAAVREGLEDLAEISDHEIVLLPNDSCGRVDLAALNDLISNRADEIGFVSIMAANNETGVIQPIEEIGEACRAAGIPFHSDATQWVGKLPLNLQDISVDMISFAGHKFHGPKGSGVLWLREGIPLHAMVQGGGQERRRRGGTESVADIVGLGVACQAARKWLDAGGVAAMEAQRARFEARIQERIPSVCVNAREGDRIWSTSNIGFPTVEAELMLLGLSEAGVCASAGSACSSGALKKSTVIGAIGRQPCQAIDQPYGSVRFSFDRLMEPSMLDSAVEIIVQVFSRLQQLAPGSEWPLDTCETATPDGL